MNREVENFLAAGRSLRVHRSRGHVLIVEEDPTLRDLMCRWVRSMDSGVEGVAGIDEVDIRRGPRMILIGSDQKDRDKVMDFLGLMETSHPASVIVVYGSDTWFLNLIHETLPRVTTVCKGEALGEFLFELNSRVHITADAV